jgi:hypothetical protein
MEELPEGQTVFGITFYHPQLFLLQKAFEIHF